MLHIIVWFWKPWFQQHKTLLLPEFYSIDLKFSYNVPKSILYKGSYLLSDIFSKFAIKLKTSQSYNH